MTDSASDYDRRVDAFARQWMTEHPERLAGMTASMAIVDNSRPIGLCWQFEDARSWSEVTYDPATFTIGFLVPVRDVGRGDHIRVMMQYDSDEIDIGVIVRGILEVDVARWQNVPL